MCYKLPVFTKCCFCIPLSPGLLVLAYLRLITAAVASLTYLSVVIQMQFTTIDTLLSVLGLLVAYFVFSIIFVVSIHTKDYRLLKKYFSFTKFYISTCTLLLLCNLGLLLINRGAARVFSTDIHNILICVLDILIQLYFIAVIKSELLKLKAEHEIAPANRQNAEIHVDMPAASDVKYEIALTNDNGKDRVVFEVPVASEQDVKCEIAHTNANGKDRVVFEVPVASEQDVKCEIAHTNANGKDRVVFEVPVASEQDVKCEIAHTNGSGKDRVVLEMSVASEQDVKCNVVSNPDPEEVDLKKTVFLVEKLEKRLLIG